MSDRTRAEMIAGIYELALWLEQHPEVPVPYELSGFGVSYVLIMTHHEADPRATIAAVARALPGSVTKSYDEGDNGQFKVQGTVGGITVKAIANRNEVCERIVTGTREVTEDVPDPDKLAKVPTISVTKTIEDIEWRCVPLLAQDKVLAEVTA